MSEVQPRRYAFDPTGTTLLVVSSDGNCRLFDVGASKWLLYNRRAPPCLHVLLIAGTGRLQVEFAARLDNAATAQACTCFCWASTVQQVQRDMKLRYVTLPMLQLGFDNRQATVAEDRFDEQW